MKRLLFTSLLVFLFSISFSASPTLVVIIPESNNVTTRSATYRYGGHTEPGNKVTVNGKTTKVYPDGAFVGLLSLDTGTNIIQFTATSPTGESKSQSFTLFRTPPPVTTPETEIKLETEGIQPSEDQVLLSGDILSIRVKGTPDAKVTASISGITNPIQMTELPSDQTRGVRGIYTGIYRVQAGDKVYNSVVSFHLVKTNNQGQLATADTQSNAKVTIDTNSWPKVGIVTYENAYLNVGLGEARLGGVQYGYIPISTKLVLDGMSGNGEHSHQYRVRLSPSLHAYIPSRFVTELPEGTPIPTSYLGLPNLESEGNYDIVHLDTDERLPFLIQESMDPPALRIHIYGATSNLTWITSKVPLACIKDITWTQVADNDLEIDLALYEPPIWGYSATYPEGSHGLEVKIRHKPVIAKAPANPLQGLTIAIDAGHGGSNQGAIGAMGIREKDCNLAIANYLKSKLEALGVKVVMTRIPETENVPMLERLNRALDADADLLVSIHCNSIGLSTDPLKTRGTTTFYKFPFNRQLARAILDRMIQIPGLPENGEVSSFNFTLGKVTNIPSVLVETAYISHPDEEALLISDSGRQQIAQAIADGLTDYFSTIRWQENRPKEQ